MGLRKQMRDCKGVRRFLSTRRPQQLVRKCAFLSSYWTVFFVTDVARVSTKIGLTAVWSSSARHVSLITVCVTVEMLGSVLGITSSDLLRLLFFVQCLHWQLLFKTHILNVGEMGRGFYYWADTCCNSFSCKKEIWENVSSIYTSQRQPWVVNLSLQT